MRIFRISHQRERLKKYALKKQKVQLLLFCQSSRLLVFTCAAVLNHFQGPWCHKVTTTFNKFFLKILDHCCSNSYLLSEIIINNIHSNNKSNTNNNLNNSLAIQLSQMNLFKLWMRLAITISSWWSKKNSIQTTFLSSMRRFRNKIFQSIKKQPKRRTNNPKGKTLMKTKNAKKKYKTTVTTLRIC